MITIEQIIDIIEDSDLYETAEIPYNFKFLDNFLKKEVRQLAAVIMNEIEKDRD